MKVLHCINTLSAGGAELHLVSLCRYLGQLGIDSVVAYLRHRVPGSRSLSADFEAAGVRTIDLGGDARYAVRPFLRLPRVVEVERPDILHSHLPRADLTAAWCRVLGARVPWVCTVHNVYTKLYSGHALMPLFRLAWRRADAVIAISEAVRDWLIEQQGLGGESVRVVRYGLDPTPFLEVVSDLRDELGLGGKPVIGCVARLDPRKGQDVLVRALPHVLAEVPDAMLVLAGHDPWGYGDELQEIARELDVADHVRLPGFEDRVPELLNSLDVFALASRSEGLGLAVLEAMASTTPVVTSRISPLTELIREGKTGKLAAPGNARSFASAIVSILRDRRGARAMALAAREQLKSTFRPQDMAEATSDVYEHLLQ